MALVDLKEARRKLDIAWLAYSSAMVPKTVILFYRIKNGEAILEQETDEEKRRVYKEYLDKLRAEVEALLKDKREVRLLKQYKDLEDAFEREHERYLKIVREAWSCGIYQEWAEHETESGTQDAGGVQEG